VSAHHPAPYEALTTRSDAPVSIDAPDDAVVWTFADRGALTTPARLRDFQLAADLATTHRALWTLTRNASPAFYASSVPRQLVPGRHPRRRSPCFVAIRSRPFLPLLPGVNMRYRAPMPVGP